MYLSNNKIYSNIITFYITFSVINWLPIVSGDIIRVFKYLVFILIFLHEFKHYKFKYPSFYLSPFGLLIVITSMLFGMILGPRFNVIIDILLPFLILWIFNFEKDFYYKSIYKASIIIAIICGLHIVSFSTGIFDFENSGLWNSPFSQSAFGGYSTGYSNSLFLFVPFLVFHHRYQNKNLLSVEIFAILAIITSQYISGGRGGLLASLVVFFIGFKISGYYKLLMIGVIIIFTQSEDFLIQMRILNPYGEEIDTDRISSGRLVSNAFFYDLFIEKPLFGHGFSSNKYFQDLEPHIVWLKNAVYGGIIYLFTLLMIFIEILRQFIKNTTLTSDENFLFYGLFFTSFIITFLEPNYLIGSVQGEFIYWMLISLLLKPSIFFVNNEVG